MSYRRKYRSGSILMQMLIAMMIVSFFYPVAVIAFEILSNIERFPYEAQDQIALAQLRRFLNGCQVTQLTSEQLHCVNEREWVLKASAHHLYLSDGTIIVLQDVDEIVFDVTDDLIWLSYQRNGVWKEALIGRL